VVRGSPVSGRGEPELPPERATEGLAAAVARVRGDSREIGLAGTQELRRVPHPCLPQQRRGRRSGELRRPGTRALTGTPDCTCHAAHGRPRPARLAELLPEERVGEHPVPAPVRARLFLDVHPERLMKRISQRRLAIARPPSVGKVSSSTRVCMDGEKDRGIVPALVRISRGKEAGIGCPSGASR